MLYVGDDMSVYMGVASIKSMAGVLGRRTLLSLSEGSSVVFESSSRSCHVGRRSPQETHGHVSSSGFYSLYVGLAWRRAQGHRVAKPKGAHRYDIS